MSTFFSLRKRRRNYTNFKEKYWEIIWYTWEKIKQPTKTIPNPQNQINKKKQRAVWKSCSSHATSSAFPPLPALMHITNTKGCISPFQYCEIPYTPGWGGSSCIMIPPCSRSTGESCTLRGIISVKETGGMICCIHLHKKCSPCALCWPLTLARYRLKPLLP